MDNFEWIRPAGKFRVDQNKDLSWIGTRPRHTYKPSDYDALYFTFAKLGDGENELLWFANKYGPLLSPQKKTRTRINAGSLQLWRAEKTNLSAVLELIFSIQAEATDDFPYSFNYDEYMIVDAELNAAFDAENFLEAEHALSKYYDFREQLENEEITVSELLIDYARIRLSQKVNTQLRDLGCSVAIDLDFQYSISPTSLLGFMWAQAALSLIHDELRPVKCSYSNCLNWYHETRHVGFCSETCARYSREERKKK